MTEPLAELDARFSSPGAVARPWDDVDRVLTDAKIFWLSTVRTDGRPHVTPLPGVWTTGALHFCTGAEEQKARNLAHEPRCVLTTGTDHQDQGLDVIVEGAAGRVGDPGLLRTLAGLWKTRLGWDFTPGDGAFRGDDGTVALVFAVPPSKILAFGKGEPYSQTRFRFPARR
ncbi:pyridoxamine 5'-phosphate oxidase family protein [Actinoplanes sp. TBRC 11911]|uniref:pyridoxamine 5'-phosphate oxidase family protein n=1 Tax=Actinoplanes sp. TBRC 11911 TaxID=2729386 RepID=UPI00145CA568|nr:pyridoxamine 5'-phosphate oxidase family protein [Actinoplanes sp. TBRC 11911]NMO53540.1 pyridoxamine 5'-phosphate oxidase family protein [Actinoplanes sp. TBRC 11911]